MPTEAEKLELSQQQALADHEKRIRQLEKIAKVGEQKLTQLIKEWNKQQKDFERAIRRLK